MESEDWEIVLLLRDSDRRFDAMEVERRTWPFQEKRALERVLLYLALALGITTRAFLSPRERELLGEISVLLIPAILHHPSFFCGLPFAMTFHDLQEEDHPERFSWRENLKRRWVNRSLAKKARVILCESPKIAHSLKSHLGVGDERLHLHTGGVRPSLLEAGMEKRNESTDGEKVILYPAQFWSHKNHARLLEALVRLEGVSLWLSGHGADQQSLAAMGKKLGVDDRIRFLGFLSDAELAQAYGDADLVVVPSLYESISLPIEEACALGTPVACSRFLGERQGIPDEMCFDPESVDDMVKTLSKGLKEPWFRPSSEQALDGTDALRKVVEKLLSSSRES